MSGIVENISIFLEWKLFFINFSLNFHLILDFHRNISIHKFFSISFRVFFLIFPFINASKIESSRVILLSLAWRTTFECCRLVLKEQMGRWKFELFSFRLDIFFRFLSEEKEEPKKTFQILFNQDDFEVEVKV